MVIDFCFKRLYSHFAYALARVVRELLMSYAPWDTVNTMGRKRMWAISISRKKIETDRYKNTVPLLVKIIAYFNAH